MAPVLALRAVVRALSASLFLLFFSPLGRALAAEAPLVVLDSGHTPGNPGALGVRGIYEVLYNDRLVGLIEARLKEAGFRVTRTRAPLEEVDLDERAARVNAARPWLLLSVHHDSAQLSHLEGLSRGGTTVYRSKQPIRGYSLFVSGAGKAYPESLKAALALGRRLLALGRPPSLHHAEQIPGEGRTLLDARLGIYRFDELKLLRLAGCPAVLLEAGVLVDEVDEAWVSDPVNQAALADAVVAALMDLRTP
jgi:N-acetylmuramoyl-L-alanine amidase